MSVKRLSFWPLVNFLIKVTLIDYLLHAKQSVRWFFSLFYHFTHYGFACFAGVPKPGIAVATNFCGLSGPASFSPGLSL